MIERVSRKVSVAIDGSIVPLAGSSSRIGRAVGERDLYRDLAKISRSDAGIARAASRWGPLARGTPLLSLYAPLLGAFFGPIRDRLATDATDWAEDDRGDIPARALFEAISGSFENLGSVMLERLAAYFEMTQADLDAMIGEIATLGPDASLGESLKTTWEAFVRRRGDQDPTQETLPRWAAELDGLDDFGAQSDRLGEVLDGLAAAADPTATALALTRLQALVPRASEMAVLVDDEASAAILAPIFALIEGLGSATAATVDGTAPSEPARPARLLVPALLAAWQGADTPGHTPLVGLDVPKLADPDSWRSALVLGVALAPPAIRTRKGLDSLIHPERALVWRELSIECALWRDAIDQLRLAETPGAMSAIPGDLRAALVRLARSIGPVLGLPETDLIRLDEDATATIRERLLRWIIARCALAGVEPRPRRGLVGTEGRALWSIHDALADVAPARRCEWPDECVELLPPGSYAHRRYCDRHRREAMRRRTARWRLRAR